MYIIQGEWNDINLKSPTQFYENMSILTAKYKYLPKLFTTEDTGLFESYRNYFK